LSAMRRARTLIRTVSVVAAFVLAVTPLVPAPTCEACFSIVVGKEASNDGYVIAAHNEDDTAPQIVNHHKIPRRKHAPGEKVKLLNGGQLPQVPQTWAYIWSEMPGMLFSDSYINEWGVSITSDNCPSREEEPEITNGGIGFMLRRLVAQRARTAREGVLLAGKLVERFGYIDSGRTYVICDPQEGWLFCVVNGKHWIAQRVADNQVAMVANTYTIRRVELSDRDRFLGSKDIIEYAKSKGWYDPKKDGPFDFASAYASPISAASPSNIGRQADGLRYVSAEPISNGVKLPFSVVPRHKISVADLMQILRHDKEGPDFSSHDDIGCPICSGATQTSFVAQLRADMPADIGIVYWVCLASPATSFYIPFHFGISAFPKGFCSESKRPSEQFYDAQVKSPFKPDPMRAFWTFANFRDKVSDAPAAVVAQVRTSAEQIEKDAFARQREIEDAARRSYRKNKTTARNVLYDYANGVYASSLRAMEKIVVGLDEAKMKANELAQKYLIIDTHQDVPYRLKKSMEDISKRTERGDFDYPRAREGGLDAVFMAVYVPADYEDEGGAYAFADETIDLVEGLAKKWPDKFVLARSVADVRKQFGGGRISIAMGMENGSPIEGNLANVKHFYDRGVRYVTLAHAKCNHLCDSSFDQERKWHGLSPFGKKVVAEMNRLGIIVDVSHVSDETFYQIMELSKAPVVATHSACRYFTPGCERNMDDDMIKLLAKNGGVVQMNFGAMFVNAQVNKQFTEQQKLVEQYIEAHELKGDAKEQYAEDYAREHPLSDADISDVVANIDHIVQLVGIDHVGLGSDFDGVGDNLPNGLKDVSCYPSLIQELLKKGYSDEDIEKICSGNFLRVWSDVQRKAAELQSGA
jgi:membrane dipeptidase